MIAENHQEPFYWFTDKTVFAFTPGTLLLKQCWLWVPSQRMSLKSNQTLAGCSHNFCATTVLEYSVGRTDCSSNALWLCWCSHFYFCRLQNIFPHQRDQNKRESTPCRHKLVFSTIKELVLSLKYKQLLWDKFNTLLWKIKIIVKT